MLVVASHSAWAGRKCDAPPETWQPRSAVGALAERNGWVLDRVKVDDGCYEINGRDAEGRRFKAKIDPASLQVIGVKREHRARELHNLAPTPTRMFTSAPAGLPTPDLAGGSGRAFLPPRFRNHDQE